MKEAGVLDKKSIIEHMVYFAVHDEYDLIGYVNMKTAMAYMFFGPNSYNICGADFVEEDYTVSLVRFASNAVVPEERDEYLVKASLENVIEQLKHNSSYEFYVHADIKGKSCVKKVRHILSPDDPKMFYFTQVDVTLLMEEEQRKQDKLRQALNLAEKANNATTQFMSRMSHDMRTPMNGILGVAALSKKEQEPAVLKEYIRKIEDSGMYLLRLINDTLDFQRIQSGKLTLHPEIVRVKEMLDNVVEMVSLSAKQKDIDFKFKNINMDDGLYIRADEIRLKQIFINLLSNALKFTSAGGAVEWECQVLEREGDFIQVKFVIRDTGTGMSQEFMEHGIFRPFSQEYNDYTNQYAGSGLGLSIVNSLIKLMGGRIEVASELGEGSEFSIYLDFEQVKPEEVEAKVQSTAVTAEQNVNMLEHKKLLLVEDHPLNAEIAKRLLENKGSTVIWVRNGLEGVEAFKNSPLNDYDAILMDIRMPVMDGLEATREIRKTDRADAKTVPIITMTANAFEEDIRKCLEAGADAHVSKPLNPKLMFETIAKYLK